MKRNYIIVEYGWHSNLFSMHHFFLKIFFLLWLVAWSAKLHTHEVYAFKANKTSCNNMKQLNLFPNPLIQQMNYVRKISNTLCICRDILPSPLLLLEYLILSNILLLHQRSPQYTKYHYLPSIILQTHILNTSSQEPF